MTVLERPLSGLPPEALALLGDLGRQAGTILEYGAGGSTVELADLGEGRLFSVETSAAWAAELRAWFAAHPTRRSVVVHHVDVGPVGRWGFPLGHAAWDRFHHYPTSVWDRHDFVHPDLVVIDGRFRLACFLTTALRIERPVTVLWDDYRDRREYHAAERYARPTKMAGRTALFRLEPQILRPSDLSWVLDAFTRPR
ncbi:hypothetical protein [Rubellimicrobium sp. CFH 75288]|uniref:hypothetical protein n=1 Tax=Rubellimicrobium sp. CFH 75288 TaxID=2697034 RepID=UPI00141276BE|nr:hypothetical protein [Rubellimicrobium sp. CFH 75288]NAZ36832.1 hypothetical protein [Rubellimicrobium sp. CFH 75288]